ncbi:MAG TPA: lysylphosphatidylglycerol synthase transmembrane domain-containing protein [Gaiellales bacterium]|nr:lysylphosphatidylglycerol synthase transmembrane domain-containing protein [Gaiellales bacterium]
MALAGIAVSVVFGWLAIRGLNFHEVRSAIAKASPAWILAAVGAALVGVTMRSERWRALFPRESRPGHVPTFWASQVGLLANNVLPVRAGELVRVLALSRETGLRRTAVLATVGVERVFDLAVVSVLQLAIASQLPDADVTRRFTLLAAGILAACAVLVIVLAIAPVRRMAGRELVRLPVLRARGGVLIDSLRTGLAALRDRELAAVALLWTLASWLVLALSGWFVLEAFDLHLPWHAAVFLLVAVTFAQAVPASAGSVGVFELAARSALVAYGVPPAVALSAGLVLHAVSALPFIVLGAVGMARLGVSGAELARAEAGA